MYKSGKYRSQIKRHLKQPILPITILVLVFIIGTIGYYLLWHKEYGENIVDALYMTVITMTTLGYMEVHPLDDTGRIFTMFIAVIGIGSLFYILTTVMENLVIIEINQFRKKKKMLKKIDNLNKHIVLVGFGRVGQLAARELLESGEDFVVVDNDFIEDDIFNIKDKILTITGDATDDSTLMMAGIDKARAMIIATADAATTVFVTLSAKVFNPELFLIVRSDDFHDHAKLIRAGANKIVNPYSIGGQRLVNHILKPHVIDFFETNLGSKTNMRIESIEITDNSNWCNKSLKELDVRKKSGATILAIMRNDETIVNPDATLTIRNNDKVLAFGTTENLEILEKSAMKVNHDN